MTGYERSGWRDHEISARHRTWGFNCPSVDLDFVMLEYYFGQPVAVVDYKHHKHYQGRDINIGHPSYRAMSELYNKDGAQLPLIICRYWPDTWAVEALGINDSARQWLPAWRPMSERTWVKGLHKLRGAVADEQAIKQTRTDLPPTEECTAA